MFNMNAFLLTFQFKTNLTILFHIIKQTLKFVPISKLF